MSREPRYLVPYCFFSGWFHQYTFIEHLLYEWYLALGITDILKAHFLLVEEYAASRKTCGKGTSSMWFTGDCWELLLKVLHFMIWVSVSQSACARESHSVLATVLIPGSHPPASRIRIFRDTARSGRLIHTPRHSCSCTLLQNSSAASTVLQGFLSDLWGSRGTVKLSDPRSGPQLMTEESREAVPWPPDPAHAETDPCPARCPRIP